MTLVVGICLCAWVRHIYSLFTCTCRLQILSSGVIVASQMSVCQESEECEGQPGDRNFQRVHFTTSLEKKRSEDGSEWWVTVSPRVFFAADSSSVSALGTKKGPVKKHSAGVLTLYIYILYMGYTVLYASGNWMIWSPTHMLTSAMRNRCKLPTITSTFE